MMNTMYLFRIDDITPGMDWNRFWALMQLFQRHAVKPLLGVVPDNRDPNLERCSRYPRFWETLRGLVESDAVDIAQHGYQHTLVHRPNASILGPSVGIRKEVSEFAGDPFYDQEFRIREGRRILQQHGISTSYWMAPNHSYDPTTLRALRHNGFTAVSDGVALFPFEHDGLVFVPQTSWRPRWMPLGVHTICLHTNEITPHHVKELRVFLRRPFHITRFSAVANRKVLSPAHAAANHSYQLAYKALWAVRRARSRVRPVRVSTTLPHTTPQILRQPDASRAPLGRVQLREPEQPLP
jgi:predicted deacetylase